MAELNTSLPTTNTNATMTDIDAKKTPNFKFYAHHHNPWLNGIAIAYVFGCYGFSLFCITTNLWWLNLLGVVLLTHTLTWAALFLHEFFHYNIFSRSSLNAVFGEAMLFLTGSCYSRFRDLVSHHAAHHVRRADFSPFFPFSMTDFLQSLPRPLLRLIIFLEWLCIPAVNLILRWMIALSPFLSESRRDERTRNALLLILRGGLFTALAIYSPRSVILYFIAYICFLHIIQFLEGFQHTYSAFKINGEVPKYSLEYEEANSYSLVLSPWLSLILCLNNNYHNAHHRLMSCPWYLLPQLDAELYPRDYLQYVPVSKLLNNYFCYRIHRLLQGQGTVERSEKGLNLDNFEGATGMSFMILRQPFDWLEISS
jgi:fatty acid desaturase